MQEKRVFCKQITKMDAGWHPFCREDVTRTRDPYVPNVVRYQLRHFSIFLNYFFSKAGAKVLLFFDMCKFLSNYFALFRLNVRFPGVIGSVLAIISCACVSVSISALTALGN